MKTKPIQRLASVIALVALALSTLVVPAFAAPSATAALGAAGKHVFPTAGDATRDFTITVNNTGTPLIGESINWVRIVLPAGETGIELKDANTTGTAPSGWTVSGAKSSRLQFLTYQASGVNAIAPGQSRSFTFPATVARPLNSERSGSFTVATSSNGGQATSNTTGDLASTVEIIEVLPGVNAIAPQGVTDNTGTAGQDIDVQYAVKNHAQQAVTVTGTLEVLTNPSAATVSNKDISTSVAPFDSTTPTTSFTHDVTLNTVTQNTNVAFRASASTAEVSRTSANFQIQVPSVLNLAAASFAPKSTKTGAGTEALEFTIDATQVGTPALTLDSGALTFGGNTATLVAPVTYTGNNEKKKLTFKMGQTDQITGTDGLLDGTFTFQTTDANGFAAELSYTLTDLIRLDNLAPEITIDVTIPDGQNGVKNGDTIGVSGTILGTDAATSTLTVTLTPDVGEPIAVTVSTTKTNDGYTFSGSATASFQKPNDPENPSTAYARSFSAQAQIKDTAGNLGNAASADFLIDNVIPFLANPGRTGEDASGDSVIEVNFADNHPQEPQLVGGCDPRLYRVDGIPGRVVEVRFGGETTSCLGSSNPEAGYDGKRILVLNYDLQPDEEPTVTYLLTDPQQARGFGLDPVVDGVKNDALRRTIDTVSGVVPLAPTLIAVERANGNGGTEPAYKDFSSRYWSRIGGNDDITVTFTGGFENGWTIQVLDENGNTINSQELTRDKIAGTDEDAPGEDGERSITVPLPDITGQQVAGRNVERAIRFVSATGNLGLPLPLDFGLDNVLPQLANLSNDGGDVTVNFTEDIVAGTNFASDWFGWENRAGDRRYYTAEEVTNGATQAQRIVSFGFEDNTLFGGVEYFFSSNGRQYEDRAGNLLASQEKAA